MHAYTHLHTFYINIIIQIFRDKAVANEPKRTVCNLYFNEVEVTVLLELRKG